MADVVSREVRSRMMSGIRGRNTKPELLLRSGLHKIGFRYRLHTKGIPGRPDMVFPKYHAVILAHGCFWHGHDCHLFRWPSSRKKFWREKINRNRTRDLKVAQELERIGWRCGVVWECALKGRERLPFEAVIARCGRWLKSDAPHLELRGHVR